MYVMLSSTVEGLLVVHNLCHDKDHEQMLALQQICAKKDAVTDQDKDSDGRSNQLACKKKELNTPSVQAAIAVLREALMCGNHKEELFEIANEIISSCSVSMQLS